MERVSGWYRRKVQLMLFVIATIVVVLLNADTLTTGRVLWRDDATRAAIVVKAEAAANGDQAEIDDAVKGLDVPLGWISRPVTGRPRSRTTGWRFSQRSLDWG